MVQEIQEVTLGFIYLFILHFRWREPAADVKTCAVKTEELDKAVWNDFYSVNTETVWRNAGFNNRVAREEGNISVCFLG